MISQNTGPAINSNNRFLKQQDEFNFKKVLGRFLEYWKMYILSVVFFVFLGLMFIRYSTPFYAINAQVMVQDGENGSSASSSFLNSNMLADFSGVFDVQSNVYNELAILQTKDLLEQVVREMNLNISYFNKGNIRDIEQYKKNPFHADYIPLGDTVPMVTFHLEFPAMGKDNNFIISTGDTSVKAKFYDTLYLANGKLIISPTSVPFQTTNYLLTLNSVDATIEDIHENLTIDLKDKETTVISLAYNTNLPKKGEDILKNLIGAYIARNLSEKNQISDSTIQFINSRIEIVSGDLGNIEKQIQDFKQENKLADITEQSKALVTNGSNYYTKLNEADVQLDVIQTMLGYIKEDENGSRPVPYVLNENPAFLAMAEQYNLLIVQKTQLLLSAKENNPAVQNIDTQISGLRNDMLKSLQNQQKAVEISRNSISKENNIVTDLVHNVPVQEREYMDLSRERDVKQALYLYLLQKKEETAITKASNISNASIIERPRTDVIAYFPNKIMIIAASLLIGLILPTAGIIAKRLFNNKILARDDITEGTNIPILAEIGHSDKSGLLSMQTEGRSIIAEHFRVFRANMDFLAVQKKCTRILITSSMTGEGKSFIATNLGMLYAYSGKKVLLMELDLRKPKLSSMLGMANTTGFSNYIISSKPHDEFINAVPDNNNLFFMSSGPIPPNPAELFMSEQMGNLFAKLEAEYDVIILDSPPIGAVADAQVLSKFSDINLFVIRQHYSLKYSLDIVNELNEFSRIPNLYLVVNDVKKGSSYRYGYGYGGYAYGYGYGYVEESKKPRGKWFSKKR